MTGRRFTWIIVAGVGAVLLFAGLDAFRSSFDGRDSATPTVSTRTPATTGSNNSLLPCDVADLTISIEVRGGNPRVVARNAGHVCYRLLRGWHLRVEDRAGDPLVEWEEIQPLADGVFPAGAEGSFGLTPEPIRCNSPGPYLVSATVGPYFARRGHLSAGDIACFGAATRETRHEIERIADGWASLFASDLQTCQSMSQPLCERVACERAGGFKIENCTPPTRAFRRSFEDVTVEDILIAGNRAAAKFSNGEVIELRRIVDRWWIEKLGTKAGRGFFE